jgi:hypothetical protein
MKMRIRHTAALVRQSIGWSAALAGLTLALLAGAGPVSARDMTPCQAKHASCSERCIMDAGAKDKGNACIQRTCVHQFKACAAASGENSNPNPAGMTPPRGVTPITGRGPRGVGSGSRPGRDAGNRDHRGGGGRGPTRRVKSPSTPAGEVRLPSGGILDNMGGGLGQQGPATTGSPVSSGGSRTPSGPVIIR